MTKPKVLLPYASRWEVADYIPEWCDVASLVEFVPCKLTTREAFCACFADSDAAALWFTEDLFSLSVDTAALIAHRPRALRLIAVPWVGCDFLETDTLRRDADITVCNIGPTAADNVADIAAYLTLSCFRLTSFWEHSFRFVDRNVWDCRAYVGSEGSEQITVQTITSGGRTEQTMRYPGRFSSADGKLQNVARDFSIVGKILESPTEKNALILGFGAIGQAVGRRLSLGLGMHVSYYKRSGPLPAGQLTYPAQFHAAMTDEMWAAADLVVLALPGAPATDNLLNAATLAKCKDGVRIVNIGRGSCVDEDALLAALDSGKVHSAGLDVYKNEEAVVDRRFFERWDVTLLPHIGSCCVDIYRRATVVTLQNIESVLIRGERGLFPLN
ncbi:AGR227Wp [Eremothecium gossypii ATCC 10895]|uniref:AGR227Wp n=1 Tax=Eremothecium gossypii (strain ATCC 10895 / CBS 109.51 / FGSC 9923 / NRRL Y-1056) TaxID=284811 RepID=Q74ZW7_EREGS|nr:AGR227Wp [Eremothecium gossypii ATCC 10895]AAS54717.1 AGR227Wp [Eremothecium gossypii ATCC 10895]